MERGKSYFHFISPLSFPKFKLVRYPEIETVCLIHKFASIAHPLICLYNEVILVSVVTFNIKIKESEEEIK